MGDWVYYITFMPMREIAARISIAESIHSADSLKELLQRELTNRSREIETYLRDQPQRFFNALVVGTYGGQPQWHEVSIRKLESRLNEPPDYLEGALGILTLQGSEKLFAIDGQHRVSGIQRALKEESKLGSEEICVIFVVGVIAAKRQEDPQGFERTRRLFTVLNRYAKPVSKRDLIALDEDDVIAITTRQLVEEYPLFKDKISVKKPKSIPSTDRESITTVVALYDSLDIFLRPQARGWSGYKRRRPDDNTLASFYSRATALFETLSKQFTQLKKVRDSKPGDNIAAKYRNARGGHLLFRPVGFQMVIRTVHNLVQYAQKSLSKAAVAVAKVPMQLAKPPWAALLWDATNRRMITAPENQTVAEDTVPWHGGQLSDLGSSEKLLRGELAGLLNTTEDKVTFERYV